MAVAADTHAVIWFLLDRRSLSAAAQAALEEAERTCQAIFVSAITLVEIHYLVERGRVAASASPLLRALLDDPHSVWSLVPVDALVTDAVPLVPRQTVPEMPDRIIAATALAMGVPLVTRDTDIRHRQSR